MRKRKNSSIQSHIRRLQGEHSDLDQVVARLALDSTVDQLLLRRLKQRKLLLKDQIAKLKSKLIPDLDA